MMIRGYDRSLAPRSRTKDSRDASPMRKTAEGLGLFLSQLTEAVREADTDSIDSGIQAQGRSITRGFKWPSPEEDAAAAGLNLTEDQAQALDMLRKARNIAIDASNSVMPVQERIESQERIQTLFAGVSAKGIEAIAPMLNRTADIDDPLLSLKTPESAWVAYNSIDSMITTLLETGARDGAGGSGNANSPYIDHNAALGASEELRAFLLDEGAGKAFARFREINRANVLGLLRQ